jgi:hypothetical protein
MTKGITPEDARARAEIAGNRAITDAMLRMVTILA